MSSSSTFHYMGVTPRDHGAYIVITAVVGVTWTVLVYCIRLYIRLNFNGPFGFDDASASFATVVGIVQSAVTLIAVRNGLGKAEDLLSPDELEAAMKLNYAASLLYIVAICGSKCAMFLLMARLTRQSQNMSLNFTQWTVVETFSILIEVVVSGMAVALVWDLRMTFKVKVAVVCAFSAQLLVIVPVIFRLIFVRRSLGTSDITFAWTEMALTTQIVMHFSIMAATFPCLRQFLQAFDSGFGATTKMETQTGSGSRTHNSYAMQSLRSKRGDEGPVHGTDGDEGRPAARGAVLYNTSGAMARLRPDRTTEIVTHATAEGPDRAGDEDRSIDSVGSDKAIIWRTREFEVHYGDRERGG
ncbi:MFS transporter [Purpureocillium lilacinum]|uniref:MFS transporter n=1 Tax=Purpureocillium lilacinum TaxID=33203 RepID=A0A179H4D8_PURLI|nr:MFS transporter [Purpureocillium lilacinum]